MGSCEPQACHPSSLGDEVILPYYPSGLSIIPGTNGVTQHHGMCVMSSQTLSDNRPTQVGAYGPLSWRPHPAGKRPLSCPLATVIIGSCAVPEFAQACRSLPIPSEPAAGHLHNAGLFQTTSGHRTSSIPPSALRAGILFPDTPMNSFKVHATLSAQKGLVFYRSRVTT